MFMSGITHCGGAAFLRMGCGAAGLGEKLILGSHPSDD